MGKHCDLTKHFSITSASEVGNLLVPLTDIIDVKHFRYLKLYNDGSRILLSNYPDCTRFMYEEGHYEKMWFDGNFPEYLVDGSYPWDFLSLVENGREKDPFEKEINLLLDLYHGITFVRQGDGCYESYTFDSNDPAIYHVDKNIFLHFMSYFKEKAYKLIKAAEHEKIYVPIKHPLFNHTAYQNDERITRFLNNTPINRYYLSGKYSNVYLTSKEIQCVLWLSQGKSAAEIALIEGNGTKTIESHLENVRNKLNCYKQTQMISILLNTGILEKL